LNELATEGNSADCGGRVLNVHAGSGAISYLRDGMRNGADLGLELRASNGCRLSKRPRKILLERAICFGDKLHRNDWHAG
jgi:hypothetical protein